MIALLIFASCAAQAQEISGRDVLDWPRFLRYAHSHNDYQQKRPLLDAIAARITSIEVDLFLDSDVVRVAHDRGQWRGEFEPLYLEPLNKLWANHALPVTDDRQFLLWLDLKEESTRLIERLDALLRKFPATSTHDQTQTRARVQVILTGKDAAKQAFIARYPSTSVTRDSNTFQENDPPGSAQWSWYALDWTKIGAWNGEGPMPPNERAQLAALVARIHAKGRKLRLWKHPATLSFWKEATNAGVDILGTDVLPATASAP